MNLQKSNPAHAGLRGGYLGRASAFLAFVAFLAALFAPALGFSQSNDGASDAQDDAADAPSGDAAAPSDAASPVRAPAQTQVGQAVARAEQATGVTAGARCAPGEADCLEVTEETEHREYRYACRQDTSDCVDDTTCRGSRQDVLYQRAQAQVRRFRREVRRELAAIHRELDEVRAVNTAQDVRLTALEDFDQRFFGWSTDTSLSERRVIARETGRYVREVLPSLLMEEEIERVEGDAEGQAAIAALRRYVDDKFADIDRRFAEERNARERLAREVAADRQHRLTAGLFASVTHIGAASPAPTYNGGAAGFSLLALPFDAPIALEGRFSFGYGETTNRGAFLFTADFLGGFDWGSGRILAGVTGSIMASSKWRETMALAGAGPIGRVEVDIGRFLTLGGGIAGLFGDTIDVNTGIGHDLTAWHATFDCTVRLGNWTPRPAASAEH